MSETTEDRAARIADDRDQKAFAHRVGVGKARQARIQDRTSLQDRLAATTAQRDALLAALRDMLGCAIRQDMTAVVMLKARDAIAAATE